MAKKRLIDADDLYALLEEFRMDCIDENSLSSYFAAHIIETVRDEYLARLPSIDAVPVVRCCECRYKETMHDGIWCAIWKEYSREGGFCHHGNRKESADNETD